MTAAMEVFRRKRAHMAGDLKAMVEQLKGMDALKRDYLCPDAMTEAVVREELVTVEAGEPKTVQGVRFVLNPTEGSDGQPVELAIDANAGAQLADRLKIPAGYFWRMHREAPGLFCTNVNHWLQRSGKTRLWREFDGVARAVLSNTYRLLDNLDVVLTALNTAKQVAPNAEVFNWAVNENRVHVMIFDPSTVAHLPTLDRLDPNVRQYVNGPLTGTIMSPHYEADGVVERLAHAEGRNPDTGGTFCFPVAEILNDETGNGKCKVKLGAGVSVCSNLCKVVEDMAQVHLGKRLDRNAELVLSRATRRKENSLVFDKIEDAIRAVFMPANFQRAVDRMVGTMEVKLEGVADAVDVVVKREGWDDAKRDAILAAWEPKVAEDTCTVFDVAMAVTRAAQDWEVKGEADTCIEMEDAVTPWFERKDCRRYFGAVLAK